jgi:AcrR family transcriptional regulator
VAEPQRKTRPPPGLSRLPPGRHGLSREFVAQNQRDRLTVGIIAAVAERGYAETTISQIVKVAGLSRRTFYAYFKTKESCYLATCAEITAHLQAVADDAAEPVADWGEKVRARLAAALEALSANPDLATFLLIAPTRAGGEIAEHYSAGVFKALAALTADMPPEVAAKRPSSAAEYGLVGGCVALITRMVESGEGEQLVDLLPDLVELILTAYLGRGAAAALS